MVDCYAFVPGEGVLRPLYVPDAMRSPSLKNFPCSLGLFLHTTSLLSSPGSFLSVGKRVFATTASLQPQLLAAPLPSQAPGSSVSTPLSLLSLLASLLNHHNGSSILSGLCLQGACPGPP